MSKNFWSEQEEEFRDTPDQNEQQQEIVVPVSVRAPTQRPQQKVAPQPEPELEPEIMSEEDEDELDQVVLSDARLRLEQGKLYELIMNHDLFSDSDADARAIKNVQREIRRFARERMEIMLGMRQEQSKQEAIVSSPFNDLEVMVLKQLASAATKGASENVNSAPVASRKPTINTIQNKSKASPQINKASVKPTQALQAKAQMPVQRKQAVVDEVYVPEEEEAPLERPPSQMSSDELLERNKRIQERQSRKKAATPTDILPQPTYEQQQMLYMTRAANPPPGLANILNLINQGGRK